MRTLAYIHTLPPLTRQWAASQASSASVYATDAASAAGVRASKAAQDVNAEMMDAWDESQLREWLLEQGILSPASKPEQLRILAKNKASRISSAMFGGPTDTMKWSASSAASWGGKSASSLASEASKSAESAASWGTKSASSLASEASKSASSAASWGAKSAESVASWGTKSVSSLASEGASHASVAAASAYNWASGQLDDSKDYVFSKWEDSDLEDWLEVHGYIKPKPASRNALLLAVREAYTKTIGPIYNSWETSTIHQWLVDHHVVAPRETKRDKLLDLMKENYYDASDKVYSAWDDSKLRDWLVSEGVLSKSSPELKHDKYLKLMDEHYENSKNVIWSAWDDSDMRNWLVNRGIIRSNAQKKRDDLIALMEKEYKNKGKTPYLAWPDARLRATLRSYGVDDKKITGRTSLLQEMRVHYIETENALTKLIHWIEDTVYDVVNMVTAAIGNLLGVSTTRPHRKTDTDN